MENRKILVSLTTLAEISEINLSNWRSKIEEIKNFNLTEIALFLTGIEKKERKELYKALEKTPVKSIPHVHLRTDMATEELEYLAKKYDVKAFNLHSTAEWPLQYDYRKYFSMIYLENTWEIPNENELKKIGGLCVDFAHWEAKRLEKDQKYCDEMEKIIQKYKIGCSHISAIKKEPTPIVVNATKKEFDSHILENLDEYDYLKIYKKYLPKYISIELENPIKEQLEAKKHIEDLIKENGNMLY